MDTGHNAAKYPLVSVITINYNHSGVTCQMLESLYKITYQNIEVIVIDNGSVEENPKIIKEKFHQVKFIEAGVNLGFAGGNNLGISLSHGKYILLINNDTIVTETFLEPLVKKMESDHSIGAVSPKIRFFHTPDTIQYAGLTAINPYTIRSRAIGFGEKDTGQYETDTLTAYAHGAAMMFSRAVVEQIGLMST
ncbi:MAG: glycosyltransferase family 2 protein, partial [Bacteroidota bacterium]